MFIAFVLIFMTPLLLWQLNRALLWMDEKDWILLPNREAARNGNSNLLNGWLEVQAIVEPAKRNVVKVRAERKDTKLEVEEKGDGPTPDP